jgi:transcription elongation factor GreB
MVFRKPGTGPKSKYITPAGYKTLTDELMELWNVERPRVTQEVADAAALGDRSENAEYIYGKKRLREIDRRVQFLRKRIEKLEIVAPPENDDGRIRFGAWVELEDEEGEVVEYRIVGADEFDISKNWISIDSPVAKALIGKREDDEVRVRRPKGTIEYTVIGYRYHEDE